MQNFLWGQPNPSRNPGKPLPPTAKAHPQEPDGRSMPVSDTPPGQGGLLSLADTVDVSCHADSMAAAIAAGAALAPLSSGSACPEHTSMALASGSPPSTNEALRRCLEALRWHGEALRRCAAGEDAALLCEEAADRRRELFWSLGLKGMQA
eukprot:TRINITY_DN21288_c0_g1_i4.p2 TRINITY_DN21288_c0_g1~~TRINITY_DN21288_c0_g1_i4.p2  ORF type:complete len:151 (+),score=31.71 TRINITY_DN21288_c0_g1_i4:252-704(+)